MVRSKMLVLHGVVLCITLTVGSGLVCKECTNLTYGQTCDRNITCNQGERCYTVTSGFGDHYNVTMGCKPEKDCLLPALIGRSVYKTNKRNIECSQCCSIDGCNQHLCSRGTTVINEVGLCADDPNFDCKGTSSVFSICADVEHAKSVCRKWCGLCGLVDGDWTLWTQWTSCDVTCGNGHKRRVRSCTDPKPAHGGLNCTGPDRDTATCQEHSCPVDGGWGTWQSWTHCSVTCGVGLVSRRRMCDNPQPALGGNYCPGDNVGYKICKKPTCNDEIIAVTVNTASGINVTRPGTNDTYSAVPLFTNVVTNIGGAYNLKTGLFTCPKTGLYQFTLTFDIFKGDYTFCYLFLNKDPISHARANRYGAGTWDENYPSASMTTALQCNSGDIVYPSCRFTEYLDRNYGTLFSGFLITDFD